MKESGFEPKCLINLLQFLCVFNVCIHLQCLYILLKSCLSANSVLLLFFCLCTSSTFCVVITFVLEKKGNKAIQLDCCKALLLFGSTVVSVWDEQIFEFDTKSFIHRKSRFLLVYSALQKFQLSDVVAQWQWWSVEATKQNMTSFVMNVYQYYHSHPASSKAFCFVYFLFLLTALSICTKTGTQKFEFPINMEEKCSSE